MITAIMLHLYFSFLSEIMKHATRILVCVIAVSKWQEFLLKVRRLFMAALRVADADIIIFVRWFLFLSFFLSFFLFSRLISAVADWMPNFLSMS